MKIKSVRLPIPDPEARLGPGDFLPVLSVVPKECVLIGGQAVAWWAERFGIVFENQGKIQPITSRDIDFWGTLDDLRVIASCLKKRPSLPGRYDLTLLVGAVAIKASGMNSAVEVLHSVPGLDTNNPQAAAVPETVVAGTTRFQILVLSPVSLVLAKLHALRHFDQSVRQDLAHLRICLQASQVFIGQILHQNLKLALWNCHRLMDVHGQKPFSKLEKQHRFHILDAIPIEEMAKAAKSGTLAAPDRTRLLKFLKLEWPRVAGE